MPWEREVSRADAVRELIRRDRETSVVREAVLQGMRSGEGSQMDADYFDGLRASVRDAS